MSQNFNLPADAKARHKMLAAHLEESARKPKPQANKTWQASHLKQPPTHGKRGNRA